MHKSKHENTHRQETINNPEFTPKIPAKKPFSLHRRPLAGQLSAHRPTRLPQQHLLLSNEHHTASPSAEAVRSTVIYRMLEEEIKVMTSRH
jgi:hypothetical protein